MTNTFKALCTAYICAAVILMLLVNISLLFTVALVVCLFLADKYNTAADKQVIIDYENAIYEGTGND